MSNKKNFNDFFPTDNSSKTNLHYDLVASKFLTGIESHQRRQHFNSSSSNDAVLLIGGLFKILFGLIGFIFVGLQLLFQSKSK